jgi:hypothetical protein
MVRADRAAAHCPAAVARDVAEAAALLVAGEADLNPGRSSQ